MPLARNSSDSDNTEQRRTEATEDESTARALAIALGISSGASETIFRKDNIPRTAEEESAYQTILRDCTPFPTLKSSQQALFTLAYTLIMLSKDNGSTTGQNRSSIPGRRLPKSD